jgi:hypothetical protein
LQQSAVAYARAPAHLVITEEGERVLIGPGVQADVVRMVLILVAGFVLGAVLIALQRALTARQARPWLPDDDRPPAGLGRLIPVGTQIEEECRRGVAALEHWLLSHRQAGRGGA